MNNNKIKEATIKAIAIEESINYGIEESLENTREADEKMTQALMALEAKNYGIAFRHAQDVLAASESIEQRLAALYIRDLAVTANKVKVENTLTIAYDTDHRLDPVAKCNKLFKRLEGTLDDACEKLIESVGKYFKNCRGELKNKVVFPKKIS